MNKEFMNAASQSGIKDHDFVFILPWLQAEAKDASPWYVEIVIQTHLLNV
jgi:hypothetical protein